PRPLALPRHGRTDRDRLSVDRPDQSTNPISHPINHPINQGAKSVTVTAPASAWQVPDRPMHSQVGTGRQDVGTALHWYEGVLPATPPTITEQYWALSWQCPLGPQAKQGAGAASTAVQ